MGNLSNYERVEIIGAPLAGASVIKPAILLGVLRATVSKVISTYTNHRKTTSAKNIGRKPTLTEADHHTMRKIDSKSHKTSAAKVTN
jgi:hypothetical protein